MLLQMAPREVWSRQCTKWAVTSRQPINRNAGTFSLKKISSLDLTLVVKLLFANWMVVGLWSWCSHSQAQVRWEQRGAGIPSEGNARNPGIKCAPSLKTAAWEAQPGEPPVLTERNIKLFSKNCFDFLYGRMEFAGVGVGRGVASCWTCCPAEMHFPSEAVPRADFKAL